MEVSTSDESSTEEESKESLREKRLRRFQESVVVRREETQANGTHSVRKTKLSVH